MDLKPKKIYLKNTLTGKIETFKPIKRKHVGMYNCGPTVYNMAHIGNMSAYIFADLLRRLFESQKYEVKQVINITDVGHLTDDGDDGEDKIEKAAKSQNISAAEITKKYTDLFMSDLGSLNINTDKIIFPRVTDHIDEQINLIKILEAKGYTYPTSDGIYFDTAKFKDYGMLGGIDIEGLQEGARVEINTEKKQATDFALWKFSNPEEKRQQQWNSPWGVGFPGWHIECSALAEKYLGKTFDVHTGGIDHIPTHHNNEIAQSEAAFGKPPAHYWMHFNHILLNGEKISKSVGNVVYMDDFAARGISPIVFRYWFLTSHYATSSNFTWDVIEANEKAFKKLVNFVVENHNPEKGKVNKKYYYRALRELNHDLGTPEAIAVIWNLIKDVKVSAADKVETILKIDQILGLGLENFNSENVASIPEEITTLANERAAARAERDFAKADAIRDEIVRRGYNIKDVGDGFEVEKA